MKRKRDHETKVWHDPHITPAGRRRSAKQQEQQEQQEQQDQAAQQGERKAEPKKRNGARIIARAQSTTDPRELERERLLHRLLVAEGRPSISSAADNFFAAEFELPPTQNVWLQLLEHSDEDRVVQAINQLSTLLDEEKPERRNVLESRLRRIEEFSDESSTQTAASALRRALAEKYAKTLG